MFSSTELQDLQIITSAARLSSYSRFLGTTTAAEAYGAYMWSMAVSTAFSPLVHALEVGFRNALNNELSAHYGNAWFQHWVATDASEQRARNRLAANQKSTGERLLDDATKKIIKRDHPNGAPAGYSPPWQRVLAEMTFGFWVTFMIKRFWDINHKQKLWPNHLSGVFPGAPSSMHAVGSLHKAFEEMVDLRNRIHHHEPLWKHASVHSCTDALAYLNSQLDSALEKLDYLGRGQRTAMERYGVVAAIKELCTQVTFDRFVGRSPTQRRPNTMEKPYHLAKKGFSLMRTKTKDTDCAWVTSNTTGAVQLVIRNGNRRFF